MPQLAANVLLSGNRVNGSAARAPNAAGAARGGEAADAAPRCVTRGESGEEARRAKVDWLHATFPQPSLTVEGLVQFLGALCGAPALAVEAGGLFGFSTRVKVSMYVGGLVQEFGSICHGGDAQQGRWLLQVTGSGCRLVKDWDGLRELLEGLGAKLTRLDLAVDLLAGEWTVDDAVRLHSEGGFSSNGRPPSTHVAGDWLDGVHGRTLYVGKAANGKSLRVYEKGKQLGDLTSPWVRYEVQFGNRDREIPLEAMTECDRYFAGAYPCLDALIAEGFAGETIPTTKTETKTSLGFLLYHLRRCYGKVMHCVMTATGVDVADLVEEVRVIGAPRRVNASGVAAGVEWADVLAQMERV